MRALGSEYLRSCFSILFQFLFLWYFGHISFNFIFWKKCTLIYSSSQIFLKFSINALFFYKFKVMDFVIVEIQKPFFNTIFVEFMKKHPKMKSVLKKSLILFPMICEFALKNCFELFCNISSVWLQLAKANSMSGKLVLR